VTTAHAKGTAFLHDEEYVVRTYGPEVWSQVLAAMSPADLATRASMLAIGWYENELLIRQLQAIEQVVRERDPHIVETLGRYAAEQDLTRIHRVFLRMANPAFVLEKSGELWGRFFDTGRWEIQRVPRGADAALVDAGVVHEVFCRNLQAYLHRLFELVGAKGVSVRHPGCRARGDAKCTYLVRWH
jgi:hypothetical protein